MVELIRGLDAARVAENLQCVRDQLGAAAPGRTIRVLAATKYVPDEELPWRLKPPTAEAKPEEAEAGQETPKAAP